jgi:hypothetical protein
MMKNEENRAEPKHNLPKNSIGLTLIMDETTPHDMRFGNEYVVGGTLIDNKNVRKFGEIAEVRYKGTELKLHDADDPEFSIEILDRAAELGRSYYSVTTTKPTCHKWSKKEDRNVHRNSVKRIIEDVLNDEKSDLYLLIDYNNKAKRGTIDRIIKIISDGRNITYEMPNSEESYQLMTNDFPVGAMGRAYNRNDDTYMNRLGKMVKRSYLDEDEAIRNIIFDEEED